MPDYSKAKIYKIYSYENDDVYYGSTIETLSRRMGHHRCHYKRYNKDNSKDYYTVFQILDFESARIELVEDFPCENKEQLLQREGFYIRKNNCVNKYIPKRTHKEWVEDNKEKHSEYQKEYREQNKKKYNEYQKEWRKRKKEQQLMLNEDTNINKI